MTPTLLRSSTNSDLDALIIQGIKSWTPTSRTELPPKCELIYQGDASKVFSPTQFPAVVIKCQHDSREEVLCMQYARRHLSSVVSIPRILYWPPFKFSRGRFAEYSLKGRPWGAWFICMDRCPGVSLDKVIEGMTPSQLDHIALQLKTILLHMSTCVRPRTLGSVTGGPYRNFFFPNYVAPKHAFTSVGEFNDHIRWMLMLFCTETFTESFLAQFPRNAAKRFAHADLLPRNIMVEEGGSTIMGIVDWSTAGFYPEYWEYARMHDRDCMTPAWDYVLQRVFPTPRRQTEIDAVRGLMSIVNSTF